MMITKKGDHFRNRPTKSIFTGRGLSFLPATGRSFLRRSSEFLKVHLELHDLLLKIIDLPVLVLKILIVDLSLIFGLKVIVRDIQSKEISFRLSRKAIISFDFGELADLVIQVGCNSLQIFFTFITGKAGDFSCNYNRD